MREYHDWHATLHLIAGKDEPNSGTYQLTWEVFDSRRHLDLIIHLRRRFSRCGIDKIKLSVQLIMTVHSKYTLDWRTFFSTKNYKKFEVVNAWV